MTMVDGKPARPPATPRPREGTIEQVVGLILAIVAVRPATAGH
jgi:hypothetical protein